MHTAEKRFASLERKIAELNKRDLRRSMLIGFLGGALLIINLYYLFFYAPQKTKSHNEIDPIDSNLLLPYVDTCLEAMDGVGGVAVKAWEETCNVGKDQFPKVFCKINEIIASLPPRVQYTFYPLLIINTTFAIIAASQFPFSSVANNIYNFWKRPKNGTQEEYDGEKSKADAFSFRA